jgi:hypothetical protein
LLKNGLIKLIKEVVNLGISKNEKISNNHSNCSKG